ncbi:hypothetical protein midi_00792 [Candidatus Midichloria mitochondrii IricVA]|uniref:Uncharacterized protein n=1 Tax=Midichloria mitochondrii (strain IricVA) TaxID=696127 RepID=F7XWN3_MIDMI|nr:hypothetical protein midi_00792 [Candidatus Midichloria mitochondrii IricVA]
MPGLTGTVMDSNIVSSFNTGVGNCIKIIKNHFLILSA